MDLSEQEASALYSVDAEERQRARFAWLARRDEVLNEWKRYLIGKRFLEHQDRDRGGSAGDHASRVSSSICLLSSSDTLWTMLIAVCH